MFLFRIAIARVVVHMGLPGLQRRIALPAGKGHAAFTDDRLHRNLLCDRTEIMHMTGDDLFAARRTILIGQTVKAGSPAGMTVIGRLMKTEIV